MDRARHCIRSGCGRPATVTLSYQYATRTAWLDDLSTEFEPSTYDLCAVHAERLRVPVGWTRDDRRSLRSLPFAPRSLAG
jgi:hypothetical protein